MQLLWSAATCCLGNPRVLVLGPHGGLLEELGDPEKEMTRKAKGSQGNRGAKSESFCCKCTYTIQIAIQDLPRSNKGAFLNNPS
jgi:hypothetical protein